MIPTPATATRPRPEVSTATRATSPSTPKARSSPTRCHGRQRRWRVGGRGPHTLRVGRTLRFPDIVIPARSHGGTLLHRLGGWTSASPLTAPSTSFPCPPRLDHPGRRHRAERAPDALGHGRVLARSAAPEGFAVGDLAARVQAMTGQDETDYTVRPAPTTPRKYWGKQWFSSADDHGATRCRPRPHAR